MLFPLKSIRRDHWTEIENNDRQLFKENQVDMIRLFPRSKVSGNYRTTATMISGTGRLMSEYKSYFLCMNITFTFALVNCLYRYS